MKWGSRYFLEEFVDYNITVYSQNHVDLVFKENCIDAWRLACFYGFPERDRRRDSWNSVRNLDNISPLSWCIVGDFNDMLYNSDKKGIHPHPQSLLDGFRKSIEDSNLIKLDLHGGLFTWEKSRKTNEVSIM